MKRNSPTLKVNPRAAREGDEVVIEGAGWGNCPVKVEIPGAARRHLRVLQGFPVPEGVRPDAIGSFVVVISTLGIEPGAHRIVATSTHRIHEARSAATFEVLARPRPDPSEQEAESPFWREVDFFRRRFGHLGFVPPGVRETQTRQMQLLRAKRDSVGQHRALPGLPSEGVIVFSAPVPNACNWTPVGAGPAAPQGAAPTVVYSGRVRSIAVDPTTPGTVYIGTANGGVWKTTDHGETWSPLSDYEKSLAIGALAIDPNNSSRVYAGTGEYHISPGVLYYYGNGFLLSPDGGKSWSALAAGEFAGESISRILFDPTDPTSQRMFLSSSKGVYESADGGVNWTQLRAGPASDLIVIVTAGPPKTIQLIAGFHFSGLWTSAWTGGAWSAWTQMIDPALPSASIGRIALGQCQNSPTTLYAAFESPSGADELAGIAKTINGGTTWTTVGKPPVNSLATNHAFYVAVHPSNPNTVYYGCMGLWKTTTGDAPWTNVTDNIHPDQNAFAFDPVNPDNVVWAVNDGGVYRSQNGGQDWEHRNRDLATLQYIHVALHSQWEAVMLGGTHDNGVHRCAGSPVWEAVGFGDAGFNAIDSSQPTRMFHLGYHSNISRSDNAGAPGAWVNKTGAITGNSQFYAPFVLDPSAPNVCYFGGDKLWRSDNNADAWSAITAALATTFDPTGFPHSVTAIAVHPLDSTTVHAATSEGRVFKVQKTGLTWALADVTTTEITGSGLPQGVWLSAIAVDTAGTVWVTVSSVLLTEATGEFSNDHVYRLLAGGSMWESRSNGLAQANPINTIVIDPTNNQRLFCGGDVGVFRTENAGLNWTTWDEGLPNAPVFHLAIHNPRRLLRAATHGRSVWERPIDALLCPNVDLYLRDNILDTGRVQPTPDNHPHPFDPSTKARWWQSVDVKVDGPAPNFQTPNPVADYVTFEVNLQHSKTRRGVTNRFYVQAHNRGPFKATNVRVCAFFADAHAGLPPLPPDFWAGGKPFNGNPQAIDWTPIGLTKTLPELQPGVPGVVEWDWLVPMTANKHSCLLTLATCDEDPLDGGSILDVGTLVTMRKQVTLKNLHVENPVMGNFLPPQEVYVLKFYNSSRRESLFDVVFDWGSLPAGARLFVAFEKLPGRRPTVLATREDLERRGVVLAHTEKRLFPAKHADGCGNVARFDPAHIYELFPAQDRTTTVPAVRIPGSRSLVAAINFILPKDVEKETAQFDVIQQSGQRIVGGSTYLLRPRKSKGGES